MKSVLKDRPVARALFNDTLWSTYDPPKRLTGVLEPVLEPQTAVYLGMRERKKIDDLFVCFYMYSSMICAAVLRY